MALKVHRWSREDLASLPDDGNRYEVLDGKLFVTPLPAPAHQVIATRLVVTLASYVEREGLGCAVGPGAVVFGENELQPDVVVFPIARSALRERWEELPRPILAVEVLSRTTRRRDLNDKREAYARIGIPEYWVVDRFERSVVSYSAHRGHPETHRGTLSWHPTGAVSPLALSVGDLLGA